MSCLEIVSVRIADTGDFTNAMHFCTAVLEPVDKGEPVVLKVYRNADNGTDLSIHLYWVSDFQKQEKSRMGLHIARGLRDYGIVSHTLWVDQKGAVPGPASRVP